MGHAKQPTDSRAQDTRVSRPLESLKDPTSFGPPPKNVNYHGGAALPNEITPHRGGLGAPLTQDQIIDARVATAPVEEEPEQSQRPAPPPLPYRADRTGLRTDNLPPPPTHQELAASPVAQTRRAPGPTPNLPPRLPSRQNTASPPVTSATPPPPSYDSAIRTTGTPTLNQSAISRLGSVGVSVPSLGIGKVQENSKSGASSTVINGQSSRKAGIGQNAAPEISELQSRFNRMNKSFNKDNTAVNDLSSTTSPSAQEEAQAPSWQQTRSALTTANSAYKDPSSVTLADAQSAAQTAQSAQRSATAFRERHNETLNAAQTRATQINKRYNVSGRLNRFLEDANSAHDEREEVARQQSGQHQPAQPQPGATLPQQQVSSPPLNPPVSELTASISRKPPPPPPPKKPANMQAPPPVPLGTKPK